MKIIREIEIQMFLGILIKKQCFLNAKTDLLDNTKIIILCSKFTSKMFLPAGLAEFTVKNSF